MNDEEDVMYDDEMDCMDSSMVCVSYAVADYPEGLEWVTTEDPLEDVVTSVHVLVGFVVHTDRAFLHVSRSYCEGHFSTPEIIPTSSVLSLKKLVVEPSTDTAC